MLFAGRSNPDLAQRIAEQLDIELGRVKLKTFANGETYCRYEESIRGADMFIVQSACDPVDRNLMELLIMINAARLASAKRITAVIPWYFYARQDKKSRPREPITRAPRRRHAAVGGRRPRAHDGPPRRPGAGLLPHPRRPHDGDPALRPVRPGPRSSRASPSPRCRPTPAGRSSPASSREMIGRRPRRPEQGAPGAAGRSGDDGHRRRRGQDRRDDGRHHRHRWDARRRSDRAQGSRGA